MTTPRDNAGAGRSARPRPPTRAELLGERALPASGELIERGRALAREVGVGRCAFLAERGVACEADYKRRERAAGRIMLHAQLGYRDPQRTRAAWGEVCEALARAGGRVDRYGICLDWSMGYPAAERRGRPRGTGLVIDDPGQLAAITAEAPVAPHLGDFVLGFPAALENTCMALAAGATSIGNLGQYFTFRLPRGDDPLAATTATVSALALIAAQPVEILVHSNLDDGFAAQFTDVACMLGAALLERHLVEGLLGARVSHCYGHHFGEPLERLAFLRALALVSDTPGTMIYGNTLAYRGATPENHASLAAYLLADIAGQRRWPSGHAVNPVPASENRRIPEVGEVIEAQRLALRLIEHAADYDPLLDPRPIERLARRIVTGGRRFAARVLAGLEAAGIDRDDPLELMLALRALGGARLEALYGPGARDRAAPHGRRPRVPASRVRAIEERARAVAAAVGPAARERIAAAGLRACVASSDVHEHGKHLVEALLGELGVACLDAGSSCEPQALAARARAGGADLIVLGTYNGIALEYARELLAATGLPVFVGGRLNQIPADSNSCLPVEVGPALAALGARPCERFEDLVDGLARLAGGPRR